MDTVATTNQFINKLKSFDCMHISDLPPDLLATIIHLKNALKEFDKNMEQIRGLVVDIEEKVAQNKTKYFILTIKTATFETDMEQNIEQKVKVWPDARSFHNMVMPDNTVRLAEGNGCLTTILLNIKIQSEVEKMIKLHQENYEAYLRMYLLNMYIECECKNSQYGLKLDRLTLISKI